MDFIVKLLFLGGKYISQAAGRTILEIIHRSREFHKHIAVRYEKVSEIIKPYDNMLELINDRVNETSDDDIHLANMNDELKKHFEEHVSKLPRKKSEQITDLGNNLAKTESNESWETKEMTSLDVETEEIFADGENGYDESNFTMGDYEHDHTYIDLCDDFYQKTNNKSDQIYSNFCTDPKLKSENILKTKIVCNDALVLDNERKNVANEKCKRTKLKEKVTSDILGHLEKRINNVNLQDFDFTVNNNSLKQKEKMRYEFGKIKQFKNLNRKILNTSIRSTNMDLLVQQAPEGSYFKLNALNGKKANEVKKLSSGNTEQNRAKKRSKQSVRQLLDAEDPIQINNRAIIRNLRKDIEHRMTLIHKNHEHFQLFEKKLQDKLINNKIKQITKDAENRCSILPHNTSHFDKCESHLETKLKKKIKGIVNKRRMSSNSKMILDAEQEASENMKQIINLLRVNEQEFQKLENKISQWLTHNQCDTNQTKRTVCKYCLTKEDNEDIEEQRRLLEVNRRAFEDLERYINSIIILEKTTQIYKNNNLFSNVSHVGHTPQPFRDRVSTSKLFIKQIDSKSKYAKIQRSGNNCKYCPTCGLSKKDRDDIRDRTNLLEINTKAFEIFENSVLSAKNSRNLTISRTMSSRSKGCSKNSDLKQSNKNEISKSEKDSLPTTVDDFKDMLDKSMVSKQLKSDKVKSEINKSDFAKKYLDSKMKKYHAQTDSKYKYDEPEQEIKRALNAKKNLAKNKSLIAAETNFESRLQSAEIAKEPDHKTEKNTINSNAKIQLLQNRKNDLEVKRKNRQKSKVTIQKDSLNEENIHKNEKKHENQELNDKSTKLTVESQGKNVKNSSDMPRETSNTSRAISDFCLKEKAAKPNNIDKTERKNSDKTDVLEENSFAKSISNKTDNKHIQEAAVENVSEEKSCIEENDEMLKINCSYDADSFMSCTTNKIIFNFDNKQSSLIKVNEAEFRIENIFSPNLYKSCDKLKNDESIYKKNKEKESYANQEVSKTATSSNIKKKQPSNLEMVKTNYNLKADSKNNVNEPLNEDGICKSKYETNEDMKCSIKVDKDDALLSAKNLKSIKKIQKNLVPSDKGTLKCASKTGKNIVRPEKNIFEYANKVNTNVVPLEKDIFEYPNKGDKNVVPSKKETSKYISKLVSSEKEILNCADTTKKNVVVPEKETLKYVGKIENISSEKKTLICSSKAMEDNTVFSERGYLKYTGTTKKEVEPLEKDTFKCVGKRERNIVTSEKGISICSCKAINDIVFSERGYLKYAGTIKQAVEPLENETFKYESKTEKDIVPSEKETLKYASKIEKIIVLSEVETLKCINKKEKNIIPSEKEILKYTIKAVKNISKESLECTKITEMDNVALKKDKDPVVLKKEISKRASNKLPIPVVNAQKSLYDSQKVHTVKSESNIPLDTMNTTKVKNALQSNTTSKLNTLKRQTPFTQSDSENFKSTPYPLYRKELLRKSKDEQTTIFSSKQSRIPNIVAKRVTKSSECYELKQRNLSRNNIAEKKFTDFPSVSKSNNNNASYNRNEETFCRNENNLEDDLTARFEQEYNRIPKANIPYIKHSKIGGLDNGCKIAVNDEFVEKPKLSENGTLDKNKNVNIPKSAFNMKGLSQIEENKIANTTGKESQIENCLNLKKSTRNITRSQGVFDTKSFLSFSKITEAVDALIEKETAKIRNENNFEINSLNTCQFKFMYKHHQPNSFDRKRQFPENEKINTHNFNEDIRRDNKINDLKPPENNVQRFMQAKSFLANDGHSFNNLETSTNKKIPISEEVNKVSAENSIVAAISPKNSANISQADENKTIKKTEVTKTENIKERNNIQKFRMLAQNNSHYAEDAINANKEGVPEIVNKTSEENCEKEIVINQNKYRMKKILALIPVDQNISENVQENNAKIKDQSGKKYLNTANKNQVALCQSSSSILKQGQFKNAFLLTNEKNNFSKSTIDNHSKIIKDRYQDSNAIKKQIYSKFQSEIFEIPDAKVVLVKEDQKQRISSIPIRTKYSDNEVVENIYGIHPIVKEEIKNKNEIYQIDLSEMKKFSFIPMHITNYEENDCDLDYYKKKSANITNRNQTLSTIPICQQNNESEKTVHVQLHNNEIYGNIKEKSINEEHTVNYLNKSVPVVQSDVKTYKCEEKHEQSLVINEKRIPKIIENTMQKMELKTNYKKEETASMATFSKDYKPYSSLLQDQKGKIVNEELYKMLYEKEASPILYTRHPSQEQKIKFLWETKRIEENRLENTRNIVNTQINVTNARNKLSVIIKHGDSYSRKDEPFSIGNSLKAFKNKTFKIEKEKLTPQLDTNKEVKLNNDRFEKSKTSKTISAGYFKDRDLLFKQGKFAFAPMNTTYSEFTENNNIDLKSTNEMNFYKSESVEVKGKGEHSKQLSPLLRHFLKQKLPEIQNIAKKTEIRQINKEKCEPSATESYYSNLEGIKKMKLNQGKNTSDTLQWKKKFSNISNSSQVGETDSNTFDNHYSFLKKISRSSYIPLAKKMETKLDNIREKYKQHLNHEKDVSYKKSLSTSKNVMLAIGLCKSPNFSSTLSQSSKLKKYKSKRNIPTILGKNVHVTFSNEEE